MQRNSRRKYVNGERTFLVNTNVKDDRGYLEVSEENETGVFYLPDYVINEMVYTFSWERQEEEYDTKSTLKTLTYELEKATDPKIIDDFKFLILTTNIHIDTNETIDFELTEINDNLFLRELTYKGMTYEFHYTFYKKMGTYSRIRNLSSI